jgi:hypothetical protein
MSNHFETGAYPDFLPAPGLRKLRSPRDGYARGWGLEYGGLREAILADPLYAEALRLAEGRTIQTRDCRLNLFLILKYFFPPLLEHSGPGSIVEFGSYRGGCAIFLAAVCELLKFEVRVIGLDTFAGMPPTSPATSPMSIWPNCAPTSKPSAWRSGSNSFRELFRRRPRACSRRPRRCCWRTSIATSTTPSPMPGKR